MDAKDMVPVLDAGLYTMYESYTVMATLEEYQSCHITDTFVVNYLDSAFAFPKNSPYR